MSEPFVAEIRIFAGNFAPRNWAFCDGQLLPIAQNTALFSIVGTTYGGDGRSTMGMPNLKGRAPMHPGRGLGLTDRRLGELGGTENVTLTTSEVSSHAHALFANTAPATSFIADSNSSLSRPVGGFAYNDDTSPASVNLNESTLGKFGEDPVAPHNNMQPYLAINFIIALIGLFPLRS